MAISNRYPAKDQQGAHKPNSRPVDFYEPTGDEDEEPPVVSGVQLNRVSSFASSTESLDPVSIIIIIYYVLFNIIIYYYYLLCII
ncbi:unnamed protein product [Anisakis simplex]|uniref:Uncharacterized protein n=1 Tax=Anisakis simplex TaxID=6269 RepID=A0A0M3KFW0_ANISI|nr:unnamed protein product [Anisakis simplex]